MIANSFRKCNKRTMIESVAIIVDLENETFFRGTGWSLKYV